MESLAASDKVRYSRHLLLPDFTAAHQLRLRQARVVIIGMGGLGHPVAQYLATCGVGHLTLVDHDVIELSNLPRQPLFHVANVGLAKAKVAAERIMQLHHDCKATAIIEQFTASNGLDLCSNHDLVIDCCDEPLTKRVIDSTAFKLGIPFISGAVSRYDGQVAVFGSRALTRYTHLFPAPADGTVAENCETLGVWGPSAGIIGNIMAQEALRMLAFGRSPLEGRYMHIDLQTYEITRFQIPSSPPPASSAMTHLPDTIIMVERSEIAQLRENNRHLEFIDLSDNNNHTHTLESLIWASADWPKEKPLLLTCPHGNRSLQAALMLAADGFKEIYCVPAETHTP